MDHFAAHEEQLASQRMRQKLEEVNVAAQTNLAPVQDYVKPLGSKFVFNIKLCSDESINRYKARLVVLGISKNLALITRRPLHLWSK